MSPILLFPLALLTPILLSISLLLPSYAAIYGASYYIYSSQPPNPLAGRYLDVFYILDVYSQLFTYWRAHLHDVSTLHYTLPLILLPLIGFYVSYWITRRVLITLINLFRMSMHH